jgi:hypothetical protein
MRCWKRVREKRRGFYQMAAEGGKGSFCEASRQASRSIMTSGRI